jgi:3-oxoacyl-[acyl-carrier protein] reductase
VVIGGMADRGFGRIVNITSGSVVAPIQGLDLSSGARAGLTAFLAGVCREYADRNVTINNILPGKMDTDRFNSGIRARSAKSNRSTDEVLADALKEIPARRLGTPEEFGQLCAFLSSRYAGYITGRNFLVDGGLFPGAF